MVTVNALRHNSVAYKPRPSGTISPVSVYPSRHDGVRIGRSNSAGYISGPGAIPYTGSTGPSPGAPMLPTMASAVPNYFIQIVDIYGVLQGVLVSNGGLGPNNFTIPSVTWELNGSGSASCIGPTSDNSLRGLIDFKGEVKDGLELRFMRELEPFYWMVPLTPEADEKEIRISGPGFLYALSRRFVGRNGEPPNLVLNGSFETNTASWSVTPLASSDWSASPSHDEEGGSVTVSATTSGNNFIYQNITLPPVFSDTFLWVTAWMYLDEAIPQNRLPTSGRGIWAIFTVNGTVVYQQGIVPNWRVAGRWQEVKTLIFLPGGQAADMQLRLYTPNGQVRWDDVRVRREERLYAMPTMEGAIVALVQHAQQQSLGKEPANIYVDGTNSQGGPVSRAYKYAERANIISAINEFPNMSEGVNWTGEIQSGTGRALVTLPRFGLDTGAPVLLEWGLNISRYRWRWDGSRRADKVIVGSRGSGFDFAEGLFDDDTTTLGWETYRPARIESLEPQGEADGLGQAYRRPISLDITAHRTASLDLFAPWRDGDFRVGRLCTVKIYEGFIRVNETFMIQRMTFIPERETWQVNVVRVDNLL